jgi:hypothetical protein
MQGMFMAYHNTLNIFGFEYLSLEEIDKYTFGGTHLAEGAFKWTASLLESICERLVTQHFSDSSFKAIKVCMETPYGIKSNILHVFAEPLIEDKGWQEKNTEDVNDEYMYTLSGQEREIYQRKLLFDPSVSEVFLFYLQLDVYVNGKYVDPFTDYLHYNENDSIMVTYKWKYKGRSSEDISLEDTYIASLRNILFLDK